MKKILKDNTGEGYIDYAIGIFCIMMVVAFVVTFLPVFTVKQSLDTFANEIVREAEIKGSTSVSTRIDTMKDQTGLDPTITWECTYFSGTKVQLNGDIKVTLEETVDIGFFSFGSFPVALKSVATGKSEVYYK